MNILNALFKTSLGKKVIMAITGLVLVGFVIGHLVGNLQIFSPPEKINAYAHLLQSLGPVLWVIRAFLLLMVGLHIWSAIALVLENKAARGAKGYANQKTLRASFASRTMKWSGLIVLAFIIYHILHFTTKQAYGPELFMVNLDGEMVPDVHTMMVLGFQDPLVSIFYLVAIGLLTLHLSHGLSSMFQSLGLRTRAWAGCLNKVSLAVCILYFLGNAAIVGACFSGFVKVQNENFQASSGELCTPNCQVCETRLASNN
ncbi:succinate dehydrogenase cytochrome b subunit [Pelagicoccus sp. SDUM812005]|uniref:succinate dehydrogenase cytochrome b subunit n=1 Tax=Pelagicoccus sp. SDUM812005 TaxID=3041257 RepID=UPI0028103243|nr:succinate dehydrogenase cytochrome b subunit [Pelagicoccus sp. SDUM812005]MDQ8181445.1 succinate dehydrogenase cytochrome b subunit [Pelagicoccus sp. SDUM812005]